jgi:hypothetical protein
MKIPLRQNLGTPDRRLRMSAGIILAALGLVLIKGTAGTIFAILSIPLLVSGITGFCPSYTFFGISTKREKTCDSAQEQPAVQ